MDPGDRVVIGILFLLGLLGLCLFRSASSAGGCPISPQAKGVSANSPTHYPSFNRSAPNGQRPTKTPSWMNISGSWELPSRHAW
jgi:hypothetical protein